MNDVPREIMLLNMISAGGGDWVRVFGANETVKKGLRDYVRKCLIELRETDGKIYARRLICHCGDYMPRLLRCSLGGPCKPFDSQPGGVK